MSTQNQRQPEQVVRDFLKRCNLYHYSDRFIAEGFDQLKSLFEVTEADLAAMDVKRGHRRLLQREIATAKGISPSTPLFIDPIYPQSSKDDIGAFPFSHYSYTPPRTLDAAGNTHANRPIVRPPFDPHTVEAPGSNSRMSSVGTSSGIGFSQTSSSGGRETSNSASNGRNSSVSSTEEDNGISDSPVTEHKRKYRRHAKPDKNAPVKPPSAYVMFSNKVRAELKDQNMSFVDLAKIVGDRWKAISPEEKEHYEQTAAREKEDYQAALSRYEQTDDHKAYQQYLSEFKSKQEVAARAVGKPRKRLKTESSPSSGSIADSSNGNSNGNSSSGSNSNGNGNGGHSHSHNHHGNQSDSAIDVREPLYSHSPPPHHNQPHQSYYTMRNAGGGGSSSSSSSSSIQPHHHHFHHRQQPYPHHSHSHQQQQSQQQQQHNYHTSSTSNSPRPSHTILKPGHPALLHDQGPIQGSGGGDSTDQSSTSATPAPVPGMHHGGPMAMDGVGFDGSPPSSGIQWRDSGNARGDNR